MAGIEGYLAVAAQFMTHKGYRRAGPSAEERVEGEFCGFLHYELRYGARTLEVSWSPATGWSARTWNFRLWDH